MFKKFGFAAGIGNMLHNDRDTELLRSELFSIEQLKRHALTLAGQHSIDPRTGPDRLLPGGVREQGWSTSHGRSR